MPSISDVTKKKLAGSKGVRNTTRTRLQAQLSEEDDNEQQQESVNKTESAAEIAKSITQSDTPMNVDPSQVVDANMMQAIMSEPAPDPVDAPVEPEPSGLGANNASPEELDALEQRLGVKETSGGTPGLFNSLFGDSRSEKAVDDQTVDPNNVPVFGEEEVQEQFDPASLQQNAASIAQLEAQAVEREQRAQQGLGSIQARINANEQKINDAIKRGINPNRFWQNKTDGDKTRIAWAMAMGALNPHGVNPALQLIKQAINNDVEAQKADLQAELQGLKASGSRLLASAKKAGAADLPPDVRVLGNLVEKYQMQIEMGKQALAQVQPGSPQEAQISQMIAEFENKVAQTSATIEDGVRNEKFTYPDSMVGKNTNPAFMSENQRERYIAGHGLATSGDKAAVRDVREEVASMDKVEGVLEQMERLHDKHGKFSIAGLTESGILVKTAVGQLRLPITGPGPLTDTEFERLKDTIGDPFSVFSLPSIERNKLRRLKKTLKGFKNEKLRSVGLRPSSSSLSSLRKK